MKRLAITVMYYNKMHAWWSTQSLLANLLSSSTVVGRTSDSLNTYLLMRWYGPGALAVVRTTGIYLLGLFCSDIQFCVLLSPYLCFISFLCFDLYVFGDDA